MRSHLIRIGNSRGLRLPKALIEQTGLEDEVELEVKGNTIVVSKVRPTRAGWSEAFAAMHERGDDRLLDAAPSTNSWDKDEWRW